jgi:hypothetical protein
LIEHADRYLQALKVLNHGSSCGFDWDSDCIRGAIDIAVIDDKLHHYVPMRSGVKFGYANVGLAGVAVPNGVVTRYSTQVAMGVKILCQIEGIKKRGRGIR